ncbi:MAG: hypothetical protein ABIH41_04945 [Nanoarchaeota archaeon]
MYEVWSVGNPEFLQEYYVLLCAQGAQRGIRCDYEHNDDGTVVLSGEPKSVEVDLKGATWLGVVDFSTGVSHHDPRIVSVDQIVSKAMQMVRWKLEEDDEPDGED